MVGFRISKKSKFTTALAVLTGAAALGTPHAQATELGYLNTLQDAGVLSATGDPCNIIDGLCVGAFTDIDDALASGRWVCTEIASGKPKSVIIDWMSTGEGLMPSPYNANVIVNAAIANLC